LHADVAALHRRACAAVDPLVHSIEGEEWRLATPCTEWNVRDLVNHLVYEHLWTPHMIAGKTLVEVGDRFEGDVLGSDPQGTWDDATDRAKDALRGPRALEGRVHTSMGRIPARDYAMQLFGDVVVHGWDLARAVGADEGLDPELVEAAYDFYEPQELILRVSGLFGRHVDAPADADTQSKLLALLGRKA
jgi:uncharacterized protein (TIGR03086 family)